METNNKGITLIALIITIIVLLILSVVTLNLSMNTGIIDTSKDAKIEYRKSEYEDEVGLIILEAKLERISGNTDTLLKIIEDKIKEKDWYSSSQVFEEEQTLASRKLIASTENINIQPNTEEPETILSNIELIVITKDNYEIGITIEEDKAELMYVTYGAAQRFTITYVANDGTEQAETGQVMEGTKVILPENLFEKENCSFLGWVDDPESDRVYQQGDVYLNNINSDIVLYAKWETYEWEKFKVKNIYHWTKCSHNYTTWALNCLPCTLYRSYSFSETEGYLLSNPVNVPKKSTDVSTAQAWERSYLGSTYRIYEYNGCYLIFCLKSSNINDATAIFDVLEAAKRSLVGKGKGDSTGEVVTSIYRNAYSDDGITDGFWYVYKDKDVDE